MRRPSCVGCVLLAAGLVPFAFGPDLNLGLMLACLVLMGTGVGLSTAGGTPSDRQPPHDVLLRLPQADGKLAP